jgi:hypothetical protein
MTVGCRLGYSLREGLRDNGPPHAGNRLSITYIGLSGITCAAKLLTEAPGY